MNSNLVKAQYDIIYKEITRNLEPSIMSFEGFVDALEIMTTKLNPNAETAFDAMNDLLNTIDLCLKS